MFATVLKLHNSLMNDSKRPSRLEKTQICDLSLEKNFPRRLRTAEAVNWPMWLLLMLSAWTPSGDVVLDAVFCKTKNIWIWLWFSQLKMVRFCSRAQTVRQQSGRNERKRGAETRCSCWRLAWAEWGRGATRKKIPSSSTSSLCADNATLSACWRKFNSFHSNLKEISAIKSPQTFGLQYAKTVAANLLSLGLRRRNIWCTEQKNGLMPRKNTPFRLEHGKQFTSFLIICHRLMQREIFHLTNNTF